jgi:hypothetical protein
VRPLPADRTLERLLRRSHLYDDPTAYEAGVRDAVLAFDRADHPTAPASPEPVVGDPGRVPLAR